LLFQRLGYGDLQVNIREVHFGHGLQKLQL